VLAVILAAVRARGAQAATVLLLTALAVGAATAAPWYVTAAADAVARADVAGAPADQLVVRAGGRTGTGRAVLPSGTPAEQTDTMLRQARQLGERTVSVPGATATLALWQTGNLVSPAGLSSGAVAYREAVCEHLMVTGSCPRRAGEAMLTRRGAERLAVRVGDRILFRTTLQSTPTTLLVVGTYELRDPAGPYWVSGAVSRTTAGGEPAFVAAGTLAALPVDEVTAEYHLVLPAATYLDPGRYDLTAELRRQQAAASRTVWRIDTTAGALAQRVVRERQLVDVGVGVAAAQLLALCWFALFFAARHTAEQRRGDIGLLRLRGQASWRVWALTAAQTVLPMLAGVPLGAAAGVAGARLLAGDIAEPQRARSALVLCLVAAVLAGLAALLAAAAAYGRGFSAGVLDLLRRVPARRRDRRGRVVDLVVVAICLAGIYQAWAVRPGAGTAAGLAVLAPGLLAVVVAVSAATAVAPVAERVGQRALRAGRLATALAAAQLARRSRLHRILVLLTVAVALLATSAGEWWTGTAARQARAEHELGADRVLTVQARSRAHLLAAVRAADPGGGQAMAVVHNGLSDTGQPVLAVDSARYPRITTALPGSTVDATTLRPPAPAPVRLSDGRLTLDATGVPAPRAAPGGRGTGPASSPERPLLLVVHLVTADGTTATVAFGPLDTARRQYPASLTGCRQAGCRLTGLELVERTGNGLLSAPTEGRGVRVAGLSGAAGPVLTGDLLTGPVRWRPGVDPRRVGPTVAGNDGQLTLTAPQQPGGGGFTRTGRVYLVDAPLPLPVVTAGAAVPQRQPGDPRLALFGGELLAVQVVGTTGVLPRDSGRAFLVDLEYADRLADGPGAGDTLQVWLARGAPETLLDRLRAQQITVLSTDSVAAARTRLDGQGPPAALRFQLLAALVGLLLSTGVLMVAAAVERADRAAELAALRRQGLTARTVRAVAYGEYAVPVGFCVVVGLVAGALATVLLPVAVPTFVDNWAVLPPPARPGPPGVAAAGLLAVLVGTATAVACASRLVRAVRSGRQS
jgi:hypothetical protein